MARRAFFSFHYDRDISRANVVRNSWVTQDRTSAGFWDASIWEEAKTKGDARIRSLIDEGLKNTSVTVVLVGQETAGREYINHEIQQSYYRGNGLLAVNIYKIKNLRGQVDEPGTNPLDVVTVIEGGKTTSLSGRYPCYNWNKDNGYENLGSWIEKAAKAAGK